MIDADPLGHAVIGGGSSGPVAFINLATRVNAYQIDLTGHVFHLYDPKGFCNGGIAYGECTPAQPLNSVRGEMSPWHAGAYHDFQFARGKGNNPLVFDARADVLPFLRREYEAAILTLRKAGATVHEHVLEVRLKKNTYGAIDILSMDKSRIIQTATPENILLCVGYGPNEKFKNLWPYQGRGYVHSPSHKDSVDAEPLLKRAFARYAVIGGGPGLYDFTNTYRGDPARTQLYIFSPTGKPLLNRNLMDEVYDFNTDIPEALSALDKNASLCDLNNAITAAFNQAARSAQYSQRLTAFNIIAHLPDVLKRLDQNVAIAFLHSAERAALMHKATPVPAESNKRLDTFNSVFVPAFVCEDQITHKPNGMFNICAGGQTIEVDGIINATGHGRTNHPIFKDLQRDGLVKFDPRFGTFKTDRTGYRLEGSGGIACVGPAVNETGHDGLETYARKSALWVDDLAYALRMCMV